MQTTNHINPLQQPLRENPCQKRTGRLTSTLKLQQYPKIDHWNYGSNHAIIISFTSTAHFATSNVFQHYLWYMENDKMNSQQAQQPYMCSDFHMDANGKRNLTNHAGIIRSTTHKLTICILVDFGFRHCFFLTMCTGSMVSPLA